MKANTSKETTKRDKSCRFVLAAIFLQGPALAQDLIQFFGPHHKTEEGSPLDYLGPIMALGQKLQDAIGRVIAADKLLFAANAAHQIAVKTRDQNALVLGRQVSAVRGACRSLFTDLTVEEYGFDKRTAQDPVPLLVQTDRVVDHLESGEAKGSGTLFTDDDFEPAKYAGHLRGSADKVRSSLDEVAETRRHAEQEMLEKMAITDEYDNLFLHGARLFESYCRLIGKQELADRLRPSEINRGQTEVEPDEVPDPVLDPTLDPPAQAVDVQEILSSVLST